MTAEKQPHRFTYYTTSELVRAVTTPKLSTTTRIAMLDEISRREKEEAAPVEDACAHNCDTGGICLAELSGFPKSCPATDAA